MAEICWRPTRMSRCRTSAPSGSELRSNWPTFVVPAKPPVRRTATVPGTSPAVGEKASTGWSAGRSTGWAWSKPTSTHAAFTFSAIDGSLGKRRRAELSVALRKRSEARLCTQLAMDESVVPNLPGLLPASATDVQRCQDEGTVGNS